MFGQLRIEVESHFKTDAVSRGQGEAAHICCDLSCAVNGIVGSSAVQLGLVSRTHSQCRQLSGDFKNAASHSESRGPSAGTAASRLCETGTFKPNVYYL